MPISGLKPAIPRKKPMQTYTLNQSATEIGLANMEFCHCICNDSRMYSSVDMSKWLKDKNNYIKKAFVISRLKSSSNDL